MMRREKLFVSTGSAVDVFASTGEYLSQVTEVAESPGAAVHGPLQRRGGVGVRPGDRGAVPREGSARPIPVEDVVDVFEAKAPGEDLEYVRQFGAGVLAAIGSLAQTVAVVEGGLAEAGTVYVTDTDTRRRRLCLVRWVRWKRRGRAKKRR